MRAELLVTVNWISDDYSNDEQKILKYRTEITSESYT